jgi:predicted MPP superfamily phosphohydrolase
MRTLFLIIFLILIDLYAYQALKVVIANSSLSAKTWSKLLFFSLNILMISFTIAYTSGLIEDWDKVSLTILRSLIFIAYLSKFLVLPFLFIDDVIRGFLYIFDFFKPNQAFNASRSRFLSQFGIFIGAIPLISLTYGIFRNAYRFQLRQTKIKIDQIPSELIGLKIIQISDIHSGSFLYPEEVNKAVEIINNQSADLVFFTGDLVNNTADEVIPLLPVLSKIKAKYGVYSILGNHDYGDYVRWENSDKKQENLDRLKLYHKELGWQLLTNENRIVNINGKEIGIIGVENFSTHMRFPKYGKLKESFSGVENTSLKLLLSHDPSHWAHEVITEFKDIAITFSGHTHGFQFGVEIPGFIQWSPIQYVYKQWAGLYKNGNQMLYVNRGLGHLGYPGRVGILPEVTLIELV